MDLNGMTKETIDQAREKLFKVWTAPSTAITGINEYDLEAPAKLLYHVITPLRNRIPRTKAQGGIQANWRAVTGINTTNISGGLEEGKSGGVMSTSTADYLAVYRGLGLDDYVTDEAFYSAEQFQDLYALATMGLLRGTMIMEEKVMLGGFGTFGLADTPQPGTTATDTDSAHGGTLAAATYSVRCVALTPAGLQLTNLTTGIVQTASRANGDGTSSVINGGSSKISPLSADCVIGTSAGTIACTVTAVPGAAGYAWFWGVKGGNILLGAITTVNAYFITATNAGPKKVADYDTANNYSQDATIFDGLIAQVVKSGSGGYYKSLDNATLTAGNDASIVELDDALQSLWDNYRLSPNTIWVSSQERRSIRSKILAAGNSAAQRFVFQTENGKLKGGSMAISYLNPFTVSNGEDDAAEEIPIKLHPNMPPGTILLDTDILPYPLSNVQNVKQMRLRRDYYQVQWPKVSRSQRFGVYFDGVLQNYFPPAFGLIQNIKKG